MSCPDIDHLIHAVGAEMPDAELEAHVLVCLSCQADFSLLSGIRALGHQPGDEISREMVERVLAELTPAEEHHGAPTASPASPFSPVSTGQVIASGVLAGFTALAAIVISGSAGSGSPTSLLLTSILVGFVAGLVHLRMRRVETLRPG